MDGGVFGVDSVATATTVAVIGALPDNGQRVRVVVQSYLVCVRGGIVCVRQAPLFIGHHDVQRRKDGA